MNRQVQYNTTYQTIHGTEPPKRITWEESSADILSTGRGFMGRFDFTMQVQVGCPGGCLFCYVPTTARLTPAAVRGQNGQTWGYVVRNKEDVIAKLTKHLHSGTLADKTLYWSGVTDPYAASPVLTQAIWETFLQASPATPAAAASSRQRASMCFRASGLPGAAFAAFNAATSCSCAP